MSEKLEEIMPPKKITNIVQTSPASGWSALVDFGTPHTSPVACWALVEYEDGTQGVEGMRPVALPPKGGLSFCRDLIGFVAYVHDSEFEGSNTVAESVATTLQETAKQFLQRVWAGR